MRAKASDDDRTKSSMARPEAQDSRVVLYMTHVGPLCVKVQPMTPEAWSVIAVGVAIAGLFIRMDVRIGRLDDHLRGQGERLARLEGKFDTLERKFDTLERQVDTLERKVDGLGGKVDTLEGKVDTLSAAFLRRQAG